MKKQGIAFLLLSILFLGSLKGNPHQKVYDQNIPEIAAFISGSGNVDYYQPAFEYSTNNIIKLNPATDYIISDNHWLVTSSFAKKPLDNEGPPSFWQENLFSILFPHHTFL